MDETMSFGAWLRRCRGLLDLTQEAFAQQLGYAFHTYRKVENDEPPSKAFVSRLADYLGASAAERDALDHFAKTGTHPTPQAFLLRILSRATQTPQPDGMSYLPLPPTRLIGRDAELAEVLEILQHLESGIVTLVGPPGVGKTRLAKQVAREISPSVADGVFFVALDEIGDSQRLLPRSDRRNGMMRSGKRRGSISAPIRARSSSVSAWKSIRGSPIRAGRSMI